LTECSSISVADGSFLRILPRRGSIPGALILDGPNEYLGAFAHMYGPHGYVRISLRGPRLHETFMAASGTVLWEQELPG
jgi:hypothetical protein